MPPAESASFECVGLSWDDSRRAFDAAEWFVRTAALGDDRWNRPGLGQWDVRVLVGHTSRSLLTVETYLARPAAAADVASAADYSRRGGTRWGEQRSRGGPDAALATVGLCGLPSTFLSATGISDREPRLQEWVLAPGDEAGVVVLLAAVGDLAATRRPARSTFEVRDEFCEAVLAGSRPGVRLRTPCHCGAGPGVDRELLRRRHGAAILNRVALARRGWHSRTQLLPDPGDPRYVATVIIGGPRRVSVYDRELFVAIDRRHSNRGPFDDTPPPASDLAALVAVAHHEGAVLRVGPEFRRGGEIPSPDAEV